MSRLNTTTNTYLLPKIVDTVLRENPLTEKILSEPEKWRGEQIKKSAKVVKNTNGTSFAGFQTLPAQAVNTRQFLLFPSKFYQIDVTLPLTDVAINMTDDERIVDLAEAEMTSSGEDMADSIGTIFQLAGTGNGSLDFNGLQNIVDDGTLAPTYGGLSRTIYATLDSTNTNFSGAISLQKMSTGYNAITDGTIMPSMGECDRSTYSFYEQLIEPKNRLYVTVPEVRKDNKEGLAGTAGFTTLTYKGIGIIPDRKVPLGYGGYAGAGQLYFLREEDLEFRAIEKFPEASPVKFVEKDFEDNDYENVKGLGFHWIDWVKPVNQLAYVGRIVLAGEFWSKNPRRHFRGYNILGIS
jgi:hypothetical protein